MALSSLVLSAGAWWLGVGSMAFVISLMASVGLIVAMTGCWVKVGRDLLPPSAALSIAGVLLRKIPFYWRILMRSNRPGWVRTDRRKS